jgi:putative hydrolase of the HAD superfamily
MRNVEAVFFDVDFTLIYPGPTFRGEGYQAFCARYGIAVDPLRFDRAVASAAALLDGPGDSAYDAAIFINYTRHIIEQMGGCGDRLDACAREIYDEWAACQHFELYDEVPAVLRELASAGLRIGLISNSHRCLASFQSHFELQGLIAAAVSSSEHGFMKPHPSIFQAALKLVNVASPHAVMVGDSVRQDVEGALRAGMRAVLLHRGEAPHARALELAAMGVPVIPSLRELLVLHHL